MPSSCTDTILTRIGNTTSFESWKSGVATALNGITIVTGVPTTEAQISTLTQQSGDIIATAACIQEKITTLSGTTNDIQAAQSEIIELNKEISEQPTNIAIARDRVAYIRHPEKHTSFYESWFPIGRPMHKANMYIFMSVIVFLLVFTLFIGLNLMGIDITVSMIPFDPNNPSSTSILFSQFTPTTILLIATVLGVLIYYVTRK